MLEADFHRFDAVCCDNWPRYRQTLHDASSTGDGRHCLETGYAADLEVVRVECLINDWMDVAGRVMRREACPSMVDALYATDERWWYIEFKRNEKTALSTLKSKLMYKAYDTVLQLVEHEMRTVRQVRENDCYIVVAYKVCGRTDDEIRRIAADAGLEATGLIDAAINGVDDSVLVRPWKADPPQVDANLDHWNGVLYKTALTLTPAQFNLYAKEQGWR